MAERNNYPKLHNAMWPGVVGKGGDAEPPIDLTTLLDLTAAARSTASSSTASTCSSPTRTVNIDSSDDDIKRLADKIARHGLGGRLGRRAGLAADRRRLGDGHRRRSASSFVDAGRQGLPHRASSCASSASGRTASSGSIPPTGVARLGARIRPATRSRSPRPSARPATSPKTTASASRPKAKSAGAACTAGSDMVDLLETVGRPEDARLPGRHGAYAALHARLQRPGGPHPARGLRLEGPRSARRGAARS